MDISYEKKGTIAIFALKGRLDSNSSPELDKQIMSLLNNDTHDILLNFSGVDYLSSAGIRILVHCHKELQKKGGQILLSNISKPIEQVLYLTGFLPYFKIFETQNEALGSIKSSTSDASSPTGFNG